MGLTPADLHWTAGFLQGRGCFGTDDSRGARRAKLRVACKDRAPLDRLKRLYGGCVFAQPMGHLYVMTGRKVVGLALMMWTLFSEPRRNEVKSMVAAWRVDSSRRERER